MGRVHDTEGVTHGGREERPDGGDAGAEACVHGVVSQAEGRLLLVPEQQGKSRKVRGPGGRPLRPDRPGKRQGRPRSLRGRQTKPRNTRRTRPFSAREPVHRDSRGLWAGRLFAASPFLLGAEFLTHYGLRLSRDYSLL